MRVIYFLVSLSCFVQPKLAITQQYIYDNIKYDSLFKTGEYFDVVDTVYPNSPMYEYSILYNFTPFPNGYEIDIISPNTISVELINLLSEYFKDTSAASNDSISMKLFRYLNEQGIFFTIGSNLFLGSYFNGYGHPCSVSMSGLSWSFRKLESYNNSLYQVYEKHCDRYLLIRWKQPTLYLGMNKIRFPVNMKDQLIMVEFPMGIEDNYCNRQ